MSEKTEIVICLGSSCFSRGNKHIVKVIEEWLREKRLRDKVYYHGSHCFSSCEKGPMLKIADKLYDGVSAERAIAILTDYFKV